MKESTPACTCVPESEIVAWMPDCPKHGIDAQHRQAIEREEAINEWFRARDRASARANKIGLLLFCLAFLLVSLMWAAFAFVANNNSFGR